MDINFHSLEILTFTQLRILFFTQLRILTFSPQWPVAVHGPRSCSLSLSPLTLSFPPSFPPFLPPSLPVVVPGPRSRSSAHDSTSLVFLVGDVSWLDDIDDDESLLQPARRHGVGCGGGGGGGIGSESSQGEIELAALIEACGSEDNVLVFGVKELRNSLSSAG